MRLIDADSVLDALGVFSDEENGNEHFLRGIESAREIVDGCEVVDVVRCKDCEKWSGYINWSSLGECGNKMVKGWREGETRYDDFCSYGVRKGEK